MSEPARTPVSFPLSIDPAAVADLRARLRATRWPDEPEDAGWSMGADVASLRSLVAYWADEFDFEARLGELWDAPHFRTSLDGLGIHFVHARAADRSVRSMPILLAHGWPDSAWRYSEVIGLLTDPGAHGADPADAFDVVVPDMPGYGWSDAPAGAPLDTVAVAGLWARLMTDLGYDRFGAAGGDIGSGVVRFLALDHADRIAAVHRMDAGVPNSASAPQTLTREERAFVDRAARWNADEGGYMHMHRTKPQTAAFGLTDSPVGLLAWIVEKLRAWSDCDGDVEQAFTRDQILTNVSIYWLTGTIASAMRMYRANAAIAPEQLARRVEVPSGFALYPADLVRPPRAWLERTTNLVRVTEPARGGHFAPIEDPAGYAAELREFFRPYRA
ncbi:epoxide hydrolase family protein [Curtobacterium sp. Leaf261]|uniref:epoxide hydrolase family protein n=1 Tax=Curtobacterium sp. Leaf261 TaxID=1736311 RepID=UPI0006FEF5A3|nr:epoxide hydrolase family protein [Curtobacterium sp. Leaf261]KQO65032.1 multidrug MFS transporter [Curtobacterium sp. Leaf261]